MHFCYRALGSDTGGNYILQFKFYPVSIVMNCEM